MKCPKCQYENPEGMQFCGKCASKLELICPQCNFSNPPDFTFCGKCAHNLSTPSEPAPRDLSFDEKIEKIQKYLPGGLTDKILAQRGKIEGEKKQVTVMFADLEDFTPLVENIGPEEAYSIMDQIYEILIHKVHDYEGTVNEMTGDGIMALFGAPIALEDAPQRAIRSAYSIHRDMTRFSDKIKQEKEGLPPLKMRIGIHTGPVVVGTLGNDLRVEFKAVGDTVNLASRMEDLAEPGATYVTEETFKLTEGLFRYESLGEKEVKGKQEPVKTFRVIGPSTQRTRFDVSAERGLTTFVGRDREIEILVDGFERVKQGRGQAFSIMAEAGVGKSRLMYEFRKAVSNEDVTILEGKCLSYSRGVPYHPIIDLYKSNFDIRENEEDYQVKDKVKGGLKTLGIDEASTLPYILELLSVKDSGIDKIPLSPEGKKARMIETMIRVPLKGSEIRPLIMVIEDLHWMDKGSEDVLKYLLESISGARILLIFTYRPEFVHTWGGRSYHNQLNLNRFSNRESLAMVNYLLGTEDIERDLEDLILEKTEGVPFFIEEYLKSLKDLKVIERKDNRYHLIKDIQDLVIPSTIQDVIMVRVDSLPEGAKEVLQTGSVIEREFGYELIKRVTDLPEKELLSNLSVLKDSELLFERGIFPESTYIFKHALTREVVYDSILIKRKKTLHGDIGNAIEEVYKENVGEYYGVLAEHFIDGDNHEKGADYSRLAAKKSEKKVALNDAIVYIRKAIASLEKLAQIKEVRKKIIDARTRLGLYMFQLFYFVQAKQAIEPIIELALKSGYKRRISQIYSIMGAHNIFIEENYPEAFMNLEKASMVSEEIDDSASIFFANQWSGYANLNQCNFKEALYHFQKAHDINVVTNATWGVSVSKSLLCSVYFYQGRLDLGRQAVMEAMRIAEDSGDTYSKAGANTYCGINCFYQGLFEEAEALLLKGLSLYERIHFHAGLSRAYLYLGLTYSEIGEYEKAKEHYENAIWHPEYVIPSEVNFIKTNLALMELACEEGDGYPESLSGIVASNKLKYYDGWIRRNIGEILLYSGDEHLSAAEGWIKKAIEEDIHNGTMWNLAMDYACYAKLLQRRGNKPEAKKMLSNAADIFRECGADGWAEKAEESLLKLE